VTAVGWAGYDFTKDWGRETKGVECVAGCLWKLCFIFAGLQLGWMSACAGIRGGISVLSICRVFWWCSRSVLRWEFSSGKTL